MGNVKDESVYERTDVYINKNQEPKEIFKRLAKKIPFKDDFNHLDVGGASGEFCGYFKSLHKNCNVYCCDVDKTLLEKGREFYSGIEFLYSDANDLSVFKDNSFDSITMTGVMTVFDVFQPSLNECLRVCKNGGKVIVTGLFNDYPVDALVKWRYSNDKGSFNRGYNLFSKKSINEFLSSHGKVKNWTFEKFHLPFDLEKQDDPIRTWTEINSQGKRVFKNGLQMEINIQFLEINL